MNELLDRIRNLNFSDHVALKNLLADMVHTICDQKLGDVREIPSIEAKLATRALNLNTHDMDEMRLLLVDMCNGLGELESKQEE